MAFDYARLTEITYVASTVGVVYTHDTATAPKSFVRLIILHNTNTTNEIVSLHIVPDSAGSVGTAADANKFAKIVVTPDQTIEYQIQNPGIIMVDDNETIQAVTTTASKVTIQIYGGTE